MKTDSQLRKYCVEVVHGKIPTRKTNVEMNSHTTYYYFNDQVKAFNKRDYMRTLPNIASVTVHERSRKRA